MLHHVVAVLALRQLNADRQQLVEDRLLALLDLRDFRLQLADAFGGAGLDEDVLAGGPLRVQAFQVLLDDSAAVGVEGELLVLRGGGGTLAVMSSMRWAR